LEDSLSAGDGTLVPVGGKSQPVLRIAAAPAAPPVPAPAPAPAPLPPPPAALGPRIRAIFQRLVVFKRSLAAACVTWFLLDVFFYGQGVWTAMVMSLIGFQADGGGVGVLDRTTVTSAALGGVVVAIVALPGYVGAVAAIERVGRRRLQMYGFAACAAAYFILGVGDRQLQTSRYGVPFVLLYGLAFAFANMGPNTTTFVLPAELFPTASRATAFGLAAAAGKLGAVLGTAVMPAILHAYDDDPSGGGAQRGVAVMMYMCAGVAVLGAAATWAFTRETRGVELTVLDSATHSEPVFVTAAEVGAAAPTPADPDTPTAPDFNHARMLVGEHRTFAADL